MSTVVARRFERYVAIGDSTTEGLDDPDGNGGYRGWANRFAERIAALQGSLLYANLAVRGRKTREIREQQLEAALAMQPDLSTVVAGTNDLIRSGFDADAVGRDVEAMQAGLIAGGAIVLTFTLPDMTQVMPLARTLRGRTLALNDALRAACESSGAVLVDLAAYPVASDPRFWSEDRLHANSLGHACIAEALAHAIRLPGATDDWTKSLTPLPSRPLSAALGAEVAWLRSYFVPWVVRHATGRSSGDGRMCKRPVLQEVGSGK